MVYIPRYVGQFRTEPNVAAGGAIPGWTHVGAGTGKWGITGDPNAVPPTGLLQIIGSNATPKTIRNNALYNLFVANPTSDAVRDIEFTFDFPIITGWPTGVETILRVRENGAGQYVDFYFSPGAAQILCRFSKTSPGEGATSTITAGWYQLVPATLPANTRMRIRGRVSGAKAATTVQLWAYTLDNANGETPYNEWSGTNTITKTLDADCTAEYGYVTLRGNWSNDTNAAHLDGLILATEGTAEDLRVEAPTREVDTDRVSVTYPDPVGGFPPYSFKIYRTTANEAINPANLLSETQTAEVTGLAIDTVVNFALVVTDSATPTPNTYQRRDTCISLRRKRRKYCQVGDSTSQGGSPRNYEAACAVAGPACGYDGPVPSGVFGVPGTAFSSWPAQTYTDLYAFINAGGYNCVGCQVGILDGATPVNTTAQNRVNLAQLILDNCPDVDDVVLFHHNMTYSAYTVVTNGFDSLLYSPTTHARNRAIQAAMVTYNGGLKIREYGGAGRLIHIAPSSEYDADLNNPQYYSSDGLHKADDGYEWKGLADGAYLVSVLQGDWGIGGSGGGGVIVQPVMRGTSKQPVTAGRLF